MDAEDEMDSEAPGRPSGGARARGSSGSRPRKRAAAAPVARKSASGGARKKGAGAKKKGGGAKKKAAGRRARRNPPAPAKRPENLRARQRRRQRADGRRRPGAGASRSQPVQRAFRAIFQSMVVSRWSNQRLTTDDPPRARSLNVPAAVPAHDSYDAVILGGGLAGLTLARQLHLEASPRAGAGRREAQAPGPRSRIQSR